MKTRSIILTVLVGLVLVASAGASEEGWRIRLNGFWMDPSDSLGIDAGPRQLARTDIDSGVGGGINAEYRFSTQLGFEIGAMAGAEADFGLASAGPDSRVVVSDSVTMSALCAGMNFHLTPNQNFDFYIGPVVALVQFSNLNVLVGPWGDQSGFAINLDDDLGLGANLGVDIPFSDSHWLFNADMRYLVTTMEGRVAGGVTESVDYDPLMVGIGFGYRF